MPLVIEPKQASSNPLDQVPNDTMTASAAQETTRSKVRHLLQGRKFDELEALAATLRREKKYDADGEAQLEIFYDGLIARGETNAEWEDDRKLYEAWLAAKPTSPAAHYALIRYWTKYGWFERNKFERDQIPSREVFKLFNERVKESQKLLIKTSESAERDPHFYVLLIDLILYAGDKPELLDKAIASSLKFDADYLPPLAKGMRYFLPRWYGGEGDMEKYGARVATQTKERHGDAVYALVAMRGAEFDTPEVLKRHHFDWERVKRGFADLRKRFPKSFAYDNWNVKFAALMEDRTETQAAFARLDAYPKAMYKLDKELEKWRRWANTDFLAGDQLAVYETLKHPVRRLEWTIDDKHWVVFDDQAELAVFDAADGKLSSRVATYAAEPRFASVVPFGKTAVAVGADGKVRAYKIPSGEARELGVHEGGVRDAALSSDGGEYATLGNDGKIKFWELDSKEEAAYEWDLSPIRISRLAFIPNSRSIAIGDSDHRVGFWNRDTKQKSIDLAPRNAAVRALRVSPDGTMLAVLAGNELTLWRLKEWELTATVSVDGYIVHEGLAFSRDGKSLAGAATRRRRAAVATGPGTESGPGQRPALEPSPAPDILVWNTADGTLRRTLRGHKAPIRSLSFNSDGTRLVSGSDDMTIRVWKTD
ncbi:MAG: hypothetical protein K8U03_05570 [Planctomycetia bacterium]|nr:hypothetical protein [Planctomycetia bacterium]